MTAFREISANEYISAFSSCFTSAWGSARAQVYVYEWFAHYLRLRDGFVLFESGERRHKHDVDDEDAKKRGFYSRLSSKPKQRDGYTQTYSSRLGYTGYGLDEFNDEVVGIRIRLLDQLMIIKGVSGSRRHQEREKIWNKILEDDMVEIWNMYFDQINAVSGSLRDDFTSIQSRFVSEINQHVQMHWKKQSGIGKLKLVANDKNERISFDSLDVCREGDAFTLSDKGGSLPIGMSVVDWKKKFRPKQQQQQVRQSSQPRQQQGQKQQSNQNHNKKRRRIIEESSSDDESSDKLPSKKRKLNNGIVIRERQEVTISSGAQVNKKTSSLDEIKRQTGVSATQLEQGYDQVEGEEFKSTMAANEDDMKEGFLADFGNTCTESSSGTNKSKCPHLISALKQLQLLRKNNEYQSRYFRNYDAENLWGDFLTLATEQWKESVEELLKVREDISSGKLMKSSDEAYDAREKCREVNMLLGIHCLDMNEYVSGEVFKLVASSSSNTASFSLSPFVTLLSETCYCFLRAAEEAFKNALILVMEQEDCQRSLPDSITNRFVKGQHFLLRGRAQHNIGQSFLEQAQCRFLKQGGNRHLRQRLLKHASKEFADALNSAKLTRGNTSAISGHSDSGLVDTDGDCTWTSCASRQSFEALKLNSLTSRSHGICLWELGKIEEAENTFYGTDDLSDYQSFLGDEQITSEEVVDALCDPYWGAMTLAEFATRSLEQIPVRAGNEKKGNGLLSTVKRALQQARLISDKILALKSKHLIEEAANMISTREEIDAEEKSICEMWEVKKKATSQKNFLPPNISLRNVSTTSTSFSRGDIGDISHRTLTSNAPRRIFVRDATSSASHRSHARRKARRNEDERQAASENFNNAFGADVATSHADGNSHVHFDPIQQKSPQNETYLKWGDELLEEHERNAYPACCPPLPPDIPLNIKLAITAKLGDILPKDDTLVAKLYN